MSNLTCPILVVSYCNDTRAAIVQKLTNLGIEFVAISQFAEAESLGRKWLYSGMMVDILTAIKAKGEEKLTHCSLSGFYPTLKVRNSDMVQNGSTNDDNLLKFINTACHSFVPRRMRAFRRKEIFLSTILKHETINSRGFTLNLSWGGAFIADCYPEKFSLGQELELYIPSINHSVTVSVRNIIPWDKQCRPGVGVEFKHYDDELEEMLEQLLHRDKITSKDRIIA